MSILDGNNETYEVKEEFAPTEDTKLKRFLSGKTIYILLIATIICLVAFLPTVATIGTIYHNAKTAENVINLSDVTLTYDLTDQYVTGSAYKFLAQIGYIAATEDAANYYYYVMYLDIDGEQVATLVEADKRGDDEIQEVIDAYLEYASDPDAGYQGSIVEITGRFKAMTSSEEELFTEGLSAMGLSGTALGYTLKIQALPEASDTIPYWCVAVPAGIGFVVCGILTVYGFILEDKREKAQLSPYPYQNQKKKKPKKDKKDKKKKK